MPRRLLDSPWTLPIICCLVAAVFRFYDLAEASLWRDEIYSIGESESLSHVVLRKGNGFGYFFLLHIMRAIFGTSAFSLRILSAIFGSLAVAVVWATALKISARRSAALVAALGMALLPLHILHSREARMYSLWAFALWVGFLCLLHLDSRQQRRMMLWGAMAAFLAALSFHNFSIIYLPGIFLAWWIYPHGPEYRSAKKRDGAVVAAVVIVAGLLMALRLGSQVPSFFRYLQTLAMAPAWAQGVGFSQSFLQIGFFPRGPQSLASLSPIAAVAVLMGFWAMAVFSSCKTLGKRQGLCVAVALLVPFLIFSLCPIRNYPRLLLPCALFLILPFAFWASRFRNGPYLTGLGLLILGGLLANAWKTVGVDREPWKKLCDEIARMSTERTAIAAWPSQTFNSFAYCYRGKGELIKLPELLERRNEFEKKEVWILFFPFLTKASNLTQTEDLETLWQLRRVPSPVPELRVLAPALAP